MSAQSHLTYPRRPEVQIGQPMGPTTYGSLMYVVTEPEPTGDGRWRVGMSAVNPLPAAASS